MSRERLADAYEEQAALLARLADVTAQIAHELRGIDSAAVRAADTGAEGASVSSPSRSSAPVPSFEDLPPEGFDEQPALKPQVDAGLGKCPIHGKPWTIKAAGVSKAGKPYKAFWKCAERDDNGYCGQKPQPIWSQTHPPEEVAA